MGVTGRTTSCRHSESDQNSHSLLFLLFHAYCSQWNLLHSLTSSPHPRPTWTRASRTQASQPSNTRPRGRSRSRSQCQCRSRPRSSYSQAPAGPPAGRVCRPQVAPARPRPRAAPPAAGVRGRRREQPPHRGAPRPISPHFPPPRLHPCQRLCLCYPQARRWHRPKSGR